MESDARMRGVFPILAMPFDAAERIDVEDLRREVEFVIEKGAHGVGIALASEVMKLSESERDLATRTVVDQAGGRGDLRCARAGAINQTEPSGARMHCGSKEGIIGSVAGICGGSVGTGRRA